MKPITALLAFMALSAVSSAIYADPARDLRNQAVEGEPAAGTEARYFVLEARHTLAGRDLADLSADGYTVLASLGGRRYLVRNDSMTEPGEVDPVIAAIKPIGAEDKIAFSARRAIVFPRATAQLRIVFHADVSLETARAVLSHAGAVVERTSAIPVDGMRVLAAAVPTGSVRHLAAAPEVLSIEGPGPRIKSMNANAALLSSVTPLYSAPYGLSGAGVTMSMYDLGAPDPNHPEYASRFTTHSSDPVVGHPTHVTGTIGASGLDARARGMAPAVRMHFFSVDLDFLDQKRSDFQTYGITSDNNSWGFVYGWDFDGKWVWYGDEEFGAYDSYSSGLDALVRQRQALIVYSAGNDDTDTGPGAPPFLHYHLNSQGDVDTGKKYCYATSTTTSDCPPAPQCDVCETLRHKGDGPFLSIGSTSAAKNVISVGSVNSAKTIASYSSRGPARDGRIKPDLVAKGDGLVSTAPNGSYATMFGTSMSAPVVTGSSLLLTEQWKRTFGGVNPSPLMLKALLVAGAEDLGLTGPDYTYGFGLVNAKASVDLIRDDAGNKVRIESGTASPGSRTEFPLSVPTGRNLRVVLAWSDPEMPVVFPNASADRSLVNDLNVTLTTPSGSQVLPWVLDPAAVTAPATHGINDRDNLEEIELPAAGLGTYRVIVTGASVPSGPQNFVLITNGNLGGAVPGCSDAFEPNDTADASFGFLRNGVNVTGRICTPSDADFFRFAVNRSGPVSLDVSVTDTPLRITLSSSAGSSSIDLAPNSTRTITTSVGSGIDQPVPAVTFTIKVESIGVLGSDSSYTLRPSFRVVAGLRSRAARR